MNAEWTLFSDGREMVAIPRSPLLVRLRRVISDEFFGQAPLASLKRLMDAVFIAGPGLILVALYLPRGGGLLVWLGILCLAVASAYWFAPHWLCRQYLSRRGFRQVGMVEAPDLAGALAAAPEAGAGK